MHGRLKIKTTAEQQAEKEKERAIKQKKYLAGLHAIFSKRNENIHDKDALEMIAQLLYVNPDASTFWNFRREVLLTFKSEINEDEWQQMCEDELKTTEYGLVKNPKSYGAWHHRDWIFRVFPSPPYAQELELCDRYLQKDERNFHCWDHRRLIVNRSNKDLSEELKFTKELIDKNFSNFSAWHYRSNLLPILYPVPKDSPHPVPEEIFLQELNLVVEAVFTDPTDQSPWFFLRWLLGKRTSKLKLIQAGLIKLLEETNLILVFNVEVPCCDGLSIFVNNQEMSTSNLHSHQDKHIWILPLHVKSIDQVLIRHEKWGLSVRLEHIKELPYYQRISNSFNIKLSSKASSALEDTMGKCLSLDKIDPGNKWVVLTLVNLMWMLDANFHKTKILSYLDQLQRIDSLRANYYADLRSKILLEEKLMSSDDNNFEAISLNLTCIASPHVICLKESVDLTGNNLKSIKPVASFLNCSSLILDGNHIKDLTPIKKLLKLKYLSMKSCNINNFDTLIALKDMQLSQLILEDNPVTELNNIKHKVSELIKSLNKLLL